MLFCHDPKAQRAPNEVSGSRQTATRGCARAARRARRLRFPLAGTRAARACENLRRERRAAFRLRLKRDRRVARARCDDRRQGRAGRGAAQRHGRRHRAARAIRVGAQHPARVRGLLLDHVLAPGGTRSSFKARRSSSRAAIRSTRRRCSRRRRRRRSCDALSPTTSRAPRCRRIEGLGTAPTAPQRPRARRRWPRAARRVARGDGVARDCGRSHGRFGGDSVPGC